MKTPESSAIENVVKELHKLNSNIEKLIFEIKQINKETTKDGGSTDEDSNV